MLAKDAARRDVYTRTGRRLPSTVWCRSARRCPPSTPAPRCAKRCRETSPMSSTSCSTWTTTTTTRGYTTARSSTPSSTSGMADKFIIALCRADPATDHRQCCISSAISSTAARRADHDHGRADGISTTWTSSGATTTFPGWARPPATWPASAMCCGIAISYNSFDVLEDGYGINLRPLSMFAAEGLPGRPLRPSSPRTFWTKIPTTPVDIPAWRQRCTRPLPSSSSSWRARLIAPASGVPYGGPGSCWIKLISRMARSPSRETTYPMLDTSSSPRLIARASFRSLRPQEEELIAHPGPLVLTQRDCCASISGSSIPTAACTHACNSNLLYHGCIPMTKNGEFEEMVVEGVGYPGKALMDFIDKRVQNAYFLPEGDPEKEEMPRFHVVSLVRRQVPGLRKGQDDHLRALFCRGQADVQGDHEPLLSAQREGGGGAIRFLRSSGCPWTAPTSSTATSR